MDTDNKVQKALKTFRNPHTCAQAVYAACAPKADEETMAVLKNSGGGRAPGGICGALYAAKLISKKDEKLLFEEFEKRIGSTLCREIKSAHMTPCEECVKVAAGLAE